MRLAIIRSIDLHRMLVRVTGQKELMSVAGLPGFNNGMIIPLFHCVGTTPYARLLLNKYNILDFPILPRFLSD